MTEPALIFDGVWKKFNRGQRFDSLRDLIPGVVAALSRRREEGALQQREFWALQNVSFEVRAGQALGIIGPNGAGKSTALKVLTRILRPDRGQSVVRGRVGALVEIAAGFHPDLTGRENVFMQGAIMGMRRAEILKKFDDIVDFAGVAEFIDTPIKRYSSGMNARLGFAVAAHLEPQVLIIDEVLSVGDLSFQEKCYERMQQFVRSGIGVVFVSHNLSAISSLCDRVMVLNKGQVEALAPTQDAITTYARLIEGSRMAAVGGSQVTLQILDGAGRPTSECEAGVPLEIRVDAFPASSGERFYAELQVRHLESGNVVYRCQSHAVGAAPMFLGPEDGVRFNWSIHANLGRGHYAITCAILNQAHRWVAVSPPAILTANERESEHALLFLGARCSEQKIGISQQQPSAIGSLPT